MRAKRFTYEINCAISKGAKNKIEKKTTLNKNNVNFFVYFSFFIPCEFEVFETHHSDGK